MAPYHHPLQTISRSQDNGSRSHAHAHAHNQQQQQSMGGRSSGNTHPDVNNTMNNTSGAVIPQRSNSSNVSGGFGSESGHTMMGGSK